MSSGPTKRPGAYPLMLDTRNKNGTPERNSASSASPGGSAVDRSRLPPGPLEASKSLKSKRPANSPINSTADKRPRIDGTPEKPTPASTGRTAATKQGAASTVTPSTESMINASRDPRKQGRGPAGSASPARTASPFGSRNTETAQHGSGRSTPVPGAPVAPRMVPSAVPYPPKRLPENGLRRDAASIRSAATKKQVLTVAGSDNAAIAQLRAKMIDSQNQHMKELEHLKSELANESSLRRQIERRLDEESETLRTAPVDPDLLKKISELSENIQQLKASRKGSLEDETYINALVARVKQSIPPPQPPMFDIAVVKFDLEKRLLKLETAVKSELGTRLEKMETDLKSDLDARLQKFKIDIKSYSKQIADFRADLSGLEDSEPPTSSKKRIDSLCKTMNGVERSIGTLREKLPQLADIQKDFSNQLDDQRKNFNSQFENVESKLSEKSTIEQLEAIRSGLQVVTDEIRNHVEEKSSALSEEIIAVVEKAQADVKRDISEIHKVTGESERHAQIRLDGLQTSVDTLTNNLESTSTALQHDIEQLQEKVKDVEESTSNHMSQLQVDLSNHQTEFNSRLHSEIDQIRVGFQSQMPTDQHTIAQPPQSSSLQGKIDDVFDDLEKLYKEVDNVAAVAESARKIAKATGLSLISEVENRFDPRFVAMREELKAYGAERETVRNELYALHDRTMSVEQRQPHVPRNEIVSMDTMAHDTRVTALEKHFESLKQQIDLRMDLLTSTQQHIEDRMQNMTTEDQCARMVHWIMSTYPNAEDFLNQLNYVKMEVRNIAAFMQEFEWLRGEQRSAQLTRLAEQVDTFSQFLQGARGPSFQNIHDLIDNNEAFRHQIAALRTEVKAEESSRREHVKIVDTLAHDNQNRVIVLEGKVDSLVRSGDSDHTKRDLRQLQDWQENVAPRVDAMESASKEQGHVLSEQRKFMGQMRLDVSALKVTAFEHQEAILAVNNNLRGGGLNLKFSQQFSNNKP